MTGTVQPNALSQEPHRLIFHGVDVLEALTAGLLCLTGMARGAISSIGRERAEDLVTDYAEASGHLDAALRSRADPSDVQEAQDDAQAARDAIVDLLTDQVDWRDRALRREDRDERDALMLGRYEDLVKRLCGPVFPDPSHLANLVDGLQGSVEATALQRDEQAAFALMLLEHLRRLPRHEMSEGIENTHHAVCASPRTAESEAASIALLEAQISTRFLEKLRLTKEYAMSLEEVVATQDRHYSTHVSSLEAEVVEARLMALRMMFVGGLSGLASAGLVYGVFRLFS